MAIKKVNNNFYVNRKPDLDVNLLNVINDITIGGNADISGNMTVSGLVDAEALSARDLDVIRSDGANIISYKEELDPDSIWIGDNTYTGDPINVIIRGDVFISGTTTQLNAQELTVQDDRIVAGWVPSGLANPVNDAFFSAYRYTTSSSNYEADMLYWSKMGSEAEITSPAVGNTPTIDFNGSESYITGRFGNALNPNNSRINASELVPSTAGAFLNTMSFNVFVTAYTAFASIIQFTPEAGSTTTEYNFYINGDGDFELNVELSGQGPIYNSLIIPQTHFPLNTWLNVSITFYAAGLGADESGNASLDRCRIHVEGVERISELSNGNGYEGQYNMESIGGDPVNNGTYVTFGGFQAGTVYIDDFIIWDRSQRTLPPFVDLANEGFGSTAEHIYADVKWDEIDDLWEFSSRYIRLLEQSNESGIYFGSQLLSFNSSTSILTLGSATINTNGEINGFNLATFDADITTLLAHEANQSNPHNVSASQVGNTTPQWNADLIYDIPIASGIASGIVSGQSLIYDGTEIVPGNSAVSAKATAVSYPGGDIWQLVTHNAGTPNYMPYFIPDDNSEVIIPAVQNITDNTCEIKLDAAYNGRLLVQTNSFEVQNNTLFTYDFTFTVGDISHINGYERITHNLGTKGYFVWFRASDDSKMVLPELTNINANEVDVKLPETITGTLYITGTTYLNNGSAVASQTSYDNNVSSGVISSDNVKGALDELAAETQSLQSQISSNDSDLSSLQSQITSNDGDIANNASGIVALQNDKVNVSDIVDNLASGVANQPLSANQGVVIDGRLNNLESEMYESFFSLNGKEDTEQTEYDNQMGVFQKFKYGPDMTSITSGNIHRSEVVLVPADSPEIDYSGGTWVDNDNVNYKFGRGKIPSNNGDSFTFDFSGTSCFMGAGNDTNKGSVKIELSSDGGSTYYDEKILTTDGGSTVQNVIYSLYDSLVYGDYTVKVTRVQGNFLLLYLGYTTKMIQRPITQYYQESTKTVSVPPLTAHCIGSGWSSNEVNTLSWNSAQTYTSTSNEFIEFTFYGSKIWACNKIFDDQTRTYSVTIDGVTTDVKNTSVDTGQGGTQNPDICVWIRLDDGTLSEGLHTVRCTYTGTNGVGPISFCGFGYYSSSDSNTLCFDTIMGKNSYAVGVDDSGFSFPVGTWSGIGDSVTSFLRRANTATSGAGAYAEYTLPANCKAVYLITEQAVNRGDMKVTLDPAGSPTIRYLNNYRNSTQSSVVQLLFDGSASVDNLTLASKVLRIECVSGTQMSVEGLVFEIWDGTTGAFDLDGWNCTQKWTRFNDSTNFKTPVSNTWEIEMVGVKNTKREWLYHPIHTGWLFRGTSAGTILIHYRTGPNLKNIKVLCRTSNNPTEVSNDWIDYSANDELYLEYSKESDPGLMRIVTDGNGTTALNWFKVSAEVRP